MDKTRLLDAVVGGLSKAAESSRGKGKGKGMTLAELSDLAAQGDKQASVSSP